LHNNNNVKVWKLFSLWFRRYRPKSRDRFRLSAAVASLGSFLQRCRCCCCCCCNVRRWPVLGRQSWEEGVCVSAAQCAQVWLWDAQYQDLCMANSPII